MTREGILLEVVGGLLAAGGLADFLHRWQKQSQQKTRKGEHGQQLKECKTRSFFHVTPPVNKIPPSAKVWKWRKAKTEGTSSIFLTPTPLRQPNELAEGVLFPRKSSKFLLLGLHLAEGV